MRRIEIRRHATKGTGPMKDMLSPEGIEQARQVGETQMRGKGFTHIAASPFFRTAQTACAMAQGAGDFTASKLNICSALFTERFDEWVAYCKANGNVTDSTNALVMTEAELMAVRFIEWLSTLPDGAHILAVGHTPFVECLVYGLTDQVIAPLKECEGVTIEIDGDGNAKFMAELRG